MSRGTDVVGLTLAEIALTLLFSFLVVVTPTLSRLKQRAKLYDATNVPKLQAALNAETAENAMLRAKNNMAAPSSNARRNLRSTAIPTCAELNGADWLFTATIIGADSYQIGGKDYSIAGILRAYSKSISDANRQGCRQRIKLFYGQDVSVPDYDHALRGIEQYFYDMKLGAEAR